MKKYVLSSALFGSLFGTSELKYQEFYNFKSPESIFLDKITFMCPIQVKSLNL